MKLEEMKKLDVEKLNILKQGICFDKSHIDIEITVDDVTDEDLVKYYGDDEFTEKDIDALYLGI